MNVELYATLGRSEANDRFATLSQQLHALAHALGYDFYSDPPTPGHWVAVKQVAPERPA